MKKFKPQLATLVSVLPAGKNWTYELKYDGYRILSLVAANGTKVYTRNLLDWTDKFGFISKTLNKFPANSILDGELVAYTEEGAISFSALQKTLKEKAKYKLKYFVFDILILQNKDLRALPLAERQKILKKYLKPSKDVLLAPQFQAKDLKALLHKVQKENLEGLIAKDLEAPYVERRSHSWLKYKINKREELCIIGYTEHSKRKGLIGALLLGLYAGQRKLVYCGKVGTGFSEYERRELYERLSKSKALSSSILNSETLPTAVKLSLPKYVCEIEYTEWTMDGFLRHPRYLGERPDKTPNQVTVKGSSYPATLKP